MTIARGRVAALAAVALLVIVAGAGAVQAKSYVTGEPSEAHPDCEVNDDGDKHASSIVVDGKDIHPAFEGTQIPVILDIQVEDDGEQKQVLTFCAGEHWDGQDPNSKDSSSDTRADESDGTVYVNPLGDCSGWNSDTARADGSAGEGCPGGTERPSQSDPLHLRLTGDADAEAAGDDETDATVYWNGELWGLGRASVAAHQDHSDRGGYLAVFLEDHSDQIFADFLDHPLGDPFNNGGNYLAYLVGPLQKGHTEESDCTSEEYQGNQGCPRDNGAFTLEYGYRWAPGQEMLP